MSDDQDKRSPIVDRYRRRGGSARKDAGKSEGFWRKLFNADGSPADGREGGGTEGADEPDEASPPPSDEMLPVIKPLAPEVDEGCERDELSEDVGLDWDDELMAESSSATPKSASALALDPLVPLPPVKPLDEEPRPAGASRELDIALCEAKTDGEGLSPVEASKKPQRLALELVLPSGSRLLLVGKISGAARAGGLLSLEVEDVPVNPERLVNGLAELSERIAAASTSPGAGDERHSVDPSDEERSSFVAAITKPQGEREALPEVALPPPKRQRERETASNLEERAPPEEIATGGVRALDPLHPMDGGAKGWHGPTGASASKPPLEATPTSSLKNDSSLEEPERRSSASTFGGYAQVALDEPPTAPVFPDVDEVAGLKSTKEASFSDETSSSRGTPSPLEPLDDDELEATRKRQPSSGVKGLTKEIPRRREGRGDGPTKEIAAPVDANTPTKETAAPLADGPTETASSPVAAPARRKRRPRVSSIQRGGAAADAKGEADPLGRWTEEDRPDQRNASEGEKASESGGEKTPASKPSPNSSTSSAERRSKPINPAALATSSSPPEPSRLAPKKPIPVAPVAPPVAKAKRSTVAPAAPSPARSAPPEPTAPAAHLSPSSSPLGGGSPRSEPITSTGRDSVAVSGELGDSEPAQRRAQPPTAPATVASKGPSASGASVGPPPTAPPITAPPAPARAEQPTPALGEIAPPDPLDRGAPGMSRRRARKTAPVVGVDFGTSYSCVALLRAGLELIPGPAGDVMIPSVASFPSPGEVIIGAEAKRRMGGEAQWTVASPKRLLGRPYKDPHVASLLGTLAMRTFAGTDQFTRFEAHGEIYSVTDICAMILGKLRERACRYLDADVTKAVFAVPVAYGSLQRSALELAAKQAGLQGVALLTEPSAALLAHGFRGRRGLAAVYDFGGGTFDFCVVSVSETAFRVVCAGGDPWLGGDDFDDALATMVADRFWNDSGIDLRTRAVEWQSLVHGCEETKRQLSKDRSAYVQVDNLLHTSDGMRGLKYKVTRKEFVKVVTELVERSVTITKQIMQQAGIDPRKVDQVVLTGGTSMIPAIRDAVTKLFGKKPMTGDPELAVVRGTALRAAELSGEAMGETSMSGRTLREVAGRTIGVGTEGGGVVTIFERDTPLPAERDHSFKTVRANQTDMIVTLYEGAKSRVDERQVLGQLRYRGLRAAPAGQNKVDFTFILDEDGLLHVTAIVEGRTFDKTIKLG